MPTLRQRLNEIVERWGIQLVLYAFMWIALFTLILVSFAVLGPRACLDPSPQVPEGFDRRNA